MRQVDLYPLLIEWFDLAVDKGNYDGRNPLEKRTAESAETAKLAEMEKIFSTTSHFQDSRYGSLREKPDRPEDTDIILRHVDPCSHGRAEGALRKARSRPELCKNSR